IVFLSVFIRVHPWLILLLVSLCLSVSVVKMNFFYTGKVIVKDILFDLDGVLVDSTEAVERVWRQWAVKRGLDPEHVANHAHGRRSNETVRAVAPELNAEQANDEVESLEIADTEGVVALPGALELMKCLPPGRWTVVTSGTRPLATTRLSV